VQFTNNSKLFDEEKWMILSTISSTNTFAKELLSKNEPVLDGTVIMAEEQTAGRGQKSNTWLSEPGKNLTFSIILDTAFLPINRQFLLNQSISLGILDALESGFGLSTWIKWPNDIYFGDYKIGGILIENLIMGNKHKNSIIGIGLNINQKQFPAELHRASSLTLLTGKEFSIKEVLKTVLSGILQRLIQLESQDTFYLEQDYRRNLLGWEQLRYFRQGDRTFQGIIKDVRPGGELCILVDGKEEEFDLQDLFFIF